MSYKTVAEIIAFKRLITEVHPTGVISIVSDTFSYWDVLTKIAPVLKVDIMNRKPNMLGLAKTVFRPDSGDPVEILCGIPYVELNEDYDMWEAAYDDCDVVYDWEDGKYWKVEHNYFDSYGDYIYQDTTKLYEIPEHEIKGSVEVLWDIFGGTITSTGHKLLNERVGLIYGDSITLERAYQILSRLEAKGFASGNVVFGIGSFTYQYNTRDTFGMAMKATYAEVNGVGYELYKDPKTDSGTKKSAKGLLCVEKFHGEYFLHDQVDWETEAKGELRTVFKDGNLVVDESLADIRNRLWANL